MWYMHEVGRGWMIIGGIMMVLFWGGIIALIAWGVSRLSRQHNTADKQAPLDIARERYAKGEISKEQFEQIKKDLST